MNPINQTENEDQHFKNLDISGISLANYVFEYCTFTQCNLSAIQLNKTKFLECKFNSCDLSNVQVKGARMRDVTFQQCKLLGIAWIHLDDFTNPAFEECNLSYNNFVGLKIRKTQFNHCIFKETDFTQTDLTECSFRGSDFLNAKFNETNLIKTDFRGAVNYLIHPILNKIKGAKFSMPEAQGLLSGLGIILE